MQKKRLETIADILRQNAGRECCLDCLGRVADIDKASVHRCVLQLINNAFFVRRRGRCQICASPRMKLLVRYRGAAPALERGAPSSSEPISSPPTDRGS